VSQLAMWAVDHRRAFTLSMLNSPTFTLAASCSMHAAAAVQMTARGMAPAGPRRGGLDLDLRQPRDEGADRIPAVWGASSPRPSAGALQSGPLV